MSSDKELFKLSLENQQLKKRLAKEEIERKKLEQEYRDLAEFAQYRKAAGE